MDNYGDYLNGMMQPPEDQQSPDLASELAKRTGRPTPYEEGGVTGGMRTDEFQTKPSNNDTPTPPPVDKSKWDTDGYGAPQYTASNFGPGLGGWDATKWADPNHQTPKYVVGRILQEASGGTGFLKDPKQREAAVANIMKAYPGATFNGKDTITMPDGGKVDIFRGAGSGEYGVAWQPITGPGGAPLPGAGGAANGPYGAGPSPMAELLRRRYANTPEQFPDNQFMNGSLENPVQFGNQSLYTQNPLYQEMMKRLLFTPKQ